MTTKIKKTPKIDPVDYARLLSNTSVSRLKSDAKTLKKQTEVAHHEALEQILAQHGFYDGWQRFISPAKRFFATRTLPSNTHTLPIVVRNLLLSGKSDDLDPIALNLWSNMNNADPDCNEWIIDLTGNPFMNCIVQSYLQDQQLPPAKVFNYTGTASIDPAGYQKSQHLLMDDAMKPMVAQALFAEVKAQQDALTLLMQHPVNALPDGASIGSVLSTLSAMRHYGLLSLMTNDPAYGYPAAACLDNFTRNILLFPSIAQSGTLALQCLWQWLRLIKLWQKEQGTRVRLVVLGLPGEQAIPHDLQTWLTGSAELEWVIAATYASVPDTHMLDLLAHSADRTYAAPIGNEQHSPAILPPYRASQHACEVSDEQALVVRILEFGELSPAPITLRTTAAPYQKTTPKLCHANGQPV